MKKSKIVVLIKILAIVILCLIAFGGIYFQESNSMKNKVKDYKVSEDLKGYREVITKQKLKTMQKKIKQKKLLMKKTKQKKLLMKKTKQKKLLIKKTKKKQKKKKVKTKKKIYIKNLNLY